MRKFVIFSVVMVIGAGVALATTLDVPFYRDGGDPESNAFPGVKNTTTTDQTITIIYTSLNASSNPTDLTVTFALSANTGVSWRPVADVGVEGPLGQSVPNNTTIGPNGTDVSIVGSIQIVGNGLAGRYQQNNVNGNASTSFAHALIPN